MSEQVGLSATSAPRKVWTCDGCSCWTDRPVTAADLVAVWYWEISEEDGDPVCYCPECR